MEWITRIEKMEDARFKTTLNPLTEIFEIRGQYKVSKRTKDMSEWVDFTYAEIKLNSDVKIESFAEIIGDMYGELKEKITTYNLINEKLMEMRWVQVIN
jgi:hypothetical protein